MKEQSFTFGKAKVTVHQPTIYASIEADYIAYDLSGEKATTRELVASRSFAEFITYTTIEGKFPFTLPPRDTPPEQLKAVFEQWGKLPRSFLTEWQNALNATEATDAQA